MQSHFFKDTGANSPGETDPKNPMASPLYGDLIGLSPVRVYVGDDEVLLDDSRRYVGAPPRPALPQSSTYGWECRMGSSLMSPDSTALRRR